MKIKEPAEGLPMTKTLNKTETIVPIIAADIVAGKTQQDIAKELGMSQANVSRIANRDDCKAMIEEQTRVLLSKLPNVISLIHSDIELSNKIADYLSGRSPVWPIPAGFEPKDLLSLYNSTYRKAQDLLKSSGILPGATSSVVISQVFHNEKTTVLTPMAQKMLDKFTAGLAIDAIDTECKDVTESEKDEKQNGTK